MTISSTNRKAGPYIGNGTTTVFPFYFKVFTAADVEVVRLTVATNVEVVLALTTNYTVTLNTDQNANPGGSITLVAGALASGYNLVITSAIGNLQPTDLTNQGGFYPDVINDALDRATIQIQQLQEGLDRAALLPITSAADSAALVADIERLATSADNLDIDANNIGSINTVAAAISNVNSVATNIANVNSVAGNATNINAVNANATNINAVNSNSTNINTVAGNNTNITTVAGISANVTSVAGNSTNINAVAGNSTNINAVNSNKTNIDAVAGNATNITAVAGNNTNITSVAGNSTNINAVVANATNINAVNANSTNINTVATNNTAINSVYTNMTAVTSAYTNIAAIIAAPTAATNAANSASQAAASAASGMYSAVQDKSANYTILAADAGDLIRVTTTSGAITITLPLISGTGIGDGFKIAVVKWTSDSNVVNIARSGSDTINGATSAQIGSQYSQIIFVADLETSQWFASQTGLGATNVNVDVFSGNGSTTAFTLASDPSTKNNTSVFISGVYQQKSTYTQSGTTITFSTAPPSGTSNIEIAYSTPLAIGTPSDGTVTAAKIVDGAITLAKLAATGTRSATTFLAGDDTFKTVAVTPTAVSDQANSSTGYFGLPAGTTAQRPGSPTNGMIRYNTTLAKVEAYQNGEWINYSVTYAVDYLLVGGGGAGGGSPSTNMTGAGGGAGGYIAGSTTVVGNTTATISIGAGGTITTNDRGNSGGSTSAFSLTAVGGGGGGGGVGANGTAPGLSGGSGGGAAGWYSGVVSGGSGTSGQGNSGGAGGVVNGAGAGGGAGAVGQGGNASGVGGNGGVGLNWQSLGTYYAGGGGGGAFNGASAAAGGSAGTGGGGAGQGTTGTSLIAGAAGTANTGGGGGGAGAYNPGCPTNRDGYNGGSGVVVIRYSGSQKGTGGTVTSAGGYTYHTFTTSSTFTA
jgi:hypothetical protein